MPDRICPHRRSGSPPSPPLREERAGERRPFARVGGSFKNALQLPSRRIKIPWLLRISFSFSAIVYCLLAIFITGHREITLNLDAFALSKSLAIVQRVAIFRTV